MSDLRTSMLAMMQHPKTNKMEAIFFFVIVNCKNTSNIYDSTIKAKHILKFLYFNYLF